MKLFIRMGKWLAGTALIAGFNTVIAQPWAPGQAPAPAPAAAAAPPPATAPAPATIPAAGGPKIVFQTPVHDFGRVNAGDVVKYTFVFTNTGTGTLVISNVQPSCGCTAAGEWSKVVEPGKTGTIPLQFSSSGFGGPVAKSVTVASNDKQQPMTYLQLKGMVWKAIDIVPSYAVMNVLPDSSAGSAMVRITNNTETAVQVWGAEVNNSAFGLQLKTNEPGRSYELQVTTVGQLKPGTTQGQISVKTSLTNSPVLHVTTWVNVQQAIAAFPPAVNLPQAPLAAAQTPIVTIINNTTNVLKLDQAAVNVAGVGVQLKEVQPGRYFTATLSFPQGFEAPRDQAIEFSVRTSIPKFEVIKVPISQAPKPTAVAAPAPSPVVPPASHSSATPPPAKPESQRVLPKLAPPLPPPLPPVAGKQGS